MRTLGIARKISMNSASSPYTSPIFLRIQFARLVKLKTTEILKLFKNDAMLHKNFKLVHALFFIRKKFIRK